MILDHEEFKDFVEQSGTELAALLDSHHTTRNFAPRVRRLLEFAETRFTLAIVGRMKNGKSSLLNALVKADLAIVGTLETTATINWFKYGAGDRTDSFNVCWKGGQPEERKIHDRDLWVGDSELAGRTRRLEFFVDTPFLKTADIVDTPGKESLSEAHQGTTDEFLSLAEADAILYVLRPIARESDAKMLEEFQATRLPNSPPHNSFAVVHKWEELEADDRHAAALDKARRIYEAMPDVVSGAMPVSAPLGRAAENFEDSFWHTMVNLAANTPSSELQEMLQGEEDFLDCESTGCPLDRAARSRLLRDFQLPWPSFKFILRTARRHSIGNPDHLRKRILEISGLPQLRQEIENRFFARERAEALKMSKLLASALELCQKAQIVLRDRKRELSSNVEKAVNAQTALEQRIRGGDAGLLSAEAFVRSELSNLKQELPHVSENLRRLGDAVVNLKAAGDEMTKDIEMLELLRSDGELSPNDANMLRSLFGACGRKVADRLSFFARFGISTVRIEDCLDAIATLQRLCHQSPEKLRPAAKHGRKRLEDIVHWLKKEGQSKIQLAASPHQS